MYSGVRTVNSQHTAFANLVGPHPGLAVAADANDDNARTHRATLPSTRPSKSNRTTSNASPLAASAQFAAARSHRPAKNAGKLAASASSFG